MIREIELAKSNWASCNVCDRKIKRGTPRGIDFSKFVCYKCFIEKNNQDIKLLQKLKYPCREEDFYILKTREKMLEHDQIWKKICAELLWTYVPTV